MQSLIEICHPQNEYLPDKSTQSQHPTGPNFKIKEFIQMFLDQTAPVLPHLMCSNFRCTWTYSE